ncbi:MAG: cytochrome c [Saprospiraceae bacterium]|nr:cytochrome c [Saprospiraceae bacterium]
MKVKNLRLTAVMALTAALLSLQSCNGDDPKGPDCNIPNADLSYTLNIKNIIDQQCISCHAPGSGVAGAVGDFRTYSGLSAYLKNGKILNAVVIDKSMPQGGGMSQAQRDSINCWIASNYPE